MSTQVIGRKGSVAKSLSGEFTAEGAIQSDKALGTHSGIGVDLEVLSEHGIPVFATSYDPRAIGHHLGADDDGGTFGGERGRPLWGLLVLFHDELVMCYVLCPRWTCNITPFPSHCQYPILGILLVKSL